MRRAVKIPLVVGGMLLSVAVALCGLVVAAFFWPSLLLNSASLRLISPIAATKGIYLQWDKAEVKASSAHTWIKSLDLHLRNLCVQAPAYNLSTCLPQVYAAIAVDVNPDHPHVVSIGPTSLLGQRLSFGPVPPSSDSTPSTFDWTRIQRPAWLRDTVLKPTHIEWQQLSLQGPGWHVDGGAQLRIAAPAADPQAPAGPPSAEAVLLLSPFCLREGPVALDGCVGRGEAKVRVAVVNEVFTLTQLGPVDITARSLALRLPQGDAEATPATAQTNTGVTPAALPTDTGATPASAQTNTGVTPTALQTNTGATPTPAQGAPSPATATWTIPPVLQAARWQPMRVQVGSWQVHRGDLTASGGLDLTVDQYDQIFDVSAKLGRVCADDGSAGLHACFEQVNLEASADRDGHTVSLDQLGPMQALGGELKYNPSAGISSPPATTKSAPTMNSILDPTAHMVPAWLEHAHLAKVQVELNKIDFVSDDRHILGAVKIDGHSAGAGSLWRLDLSGKGDGKGPLKTVSADLELASGQGHFSGPWRMRGDGKAVLTEGSDVAVHAHTSNPKPGVLAFEVNAKTSKGQQVATAKLDGQLDDHGVGVRVDGSLLGMIPKIKRLTLNDCRIKLGWRHTWPDEGQLAMGCGLALQPEALPKQDEIPIEWPTALHFKLQADGRLPLPPGAPGKVQGEVHLDLDPIITHEFALTSATSAKVNGTLAELPHSLNIAIESATQLAVPDFGAVVKSLGNSLYAVPAPLNVLRGRVAAQIKASGDLTNGGIDVPILFTSRLKSGQASQNDEQRLDTDMGGTLHLDPLGEAPEPRLDFKALLSDVQLALPRITLADSKAPQVLPDGRMRSTKAVRAEANAKGLLPSQHPDILVGPPAPPPKPALAYSVQVLSPPNNPLHLVSNLAKAPIPIQVDIIATSEAPAQGHVAVREFPLNLFRRKAYVDKFDLVIANPQASPTIDGKLRVEYTDYTITILLLGTLKSPEIKLSSEPPRPENQLIAVLLFGKEMDELDDDQLKSVDSFGGAAADGALSLASMYLLASTPVQSVGYNPQNGAFTAKINVGKGTSVNIGSDLGDYQKLGVQKRLARDWSVETYIERNTDADTDAVTALLEWSRRF